MTTRRPPAVPMPFVPPPGTEALHGRGTPWRIAHRYEAHAREAWDDGWGSLDQAVEAVPTRPGTQVIEERAGRILSRNDSPDIGFDRSVNPYRGCEHGCIYCFARPTHSYLNLSPGLDFETRLQAKVNAADRLRETFAAPSYTPGLLNVGSATDAYQPIERDWKITRSVLEVLAETRHPFSLVTKSAGVERDLDLMAPMAAERLCAIYVSLTTLDPQLARTMEPRAAAPHRRLRAIRTLADAGVPVGVSVSPMIPFLNEPELERLLDAAAQAGARSAFMVVLRLPWEVNPLFQQWLREHYPERADRVMARVRDMRGGKDYDADFSQRMRGTGLWADLLSQRFRQACRRLGLNREREPLAMDRFTPPPRPVRTIAGRAEPPSGAAHDPPSQAELF